MKEPCLLTWFLWLVLNKLAHTTQNYIIRSSITCSGMGPPIAIKKKSRKSSTDLPRGQDLGSSSVEIPRWICILSSWQMKLTVAISHNITMVWNHHIYGDLATCSILSKPWLWFQILSLLFRSGWLQKPTDCCPSKFNSRVVSETNWVPSMCSHV